MGRRYRSVDITDGVELPVWLRYRRWLWLMPMARLRQMRGTYYQKKFGYKRNGDVYEIDKKCVGVICTVVILAFNDMSIKTICDATGLSEKQVYTVFKNYKYYVGWHNSYLPDGRRIYPPIREIQNIHTDFTNDVIEC